MDRNSLICLNKKTYNYQDRELYSRCVGSPAMVLIIPCARRSSRRNFVKKLKEMKAFPLR